MSDNKALKTTLKIVSKLVKAVLSFVIITGTIYWFNLENKLLYYVVRPFLNKHYDSQVRDRKI